MKKQTYVCFLPTDPPTNLIRPMVFEITEGQLIRIKCSVDSAPPSRLHLITPKSPEWSVLHCYPPAPPNSLCHIFNVTSAYAGSYTCSADNGIGSKQSDQWKLMVKCEYIVFLLIKQMMSKPECSIKLLI